MLALLLACLGSTVVVDDSGDADSGDGADTADTGDTASSRDLDGDGYVAGADCMDLNADVHPGATELWNGLDDDCDGVFDADGDWGGDLRGEATAVYEGRPYSFDFPCSGSGTRAAGRFDWSVVCTPSAADDDAQLMLGEAVTVTPDDPAVDGDAWSGVVLVASTNGWDTDGSGSIAWSTFEAATFRASLDAFSLELAVTGTIARE